MTFAKDTVTNNVVGNRRRRRNGQAHFIFITKNHYNMMRTRRISICFFNVRIRLLRYIIILYTLLEYNVRVYKRAALIATSFRSPFYVQRPCIL